MQDVTPTLLEYAGVQPANSAYEGRPVHPIMGKSLKPLFDGVVEQAYEDNEPVAQEMFNNTAIWKGDWKAVRNMQPLSDGQWHLFNYTADIGENNDLASQHPEILNELMTDYENFAKDVGVVIPNASIEAFQTVAAGPET